MAQHKLSGEVVSSAGYVTRGFAPEHEDEKAHVLEHQ